MLELRIYKITDAGPKDNEDSCYVVQHSYSSVLACIADGVSSAEDARATSTFITDYVEDWYEEEGNDLFTTPPELVSGKLTSLVSDMHNDLLAQVKLMKMSEKDACRFGSTVDIAVIGKRKMFIAHVGDSRVYLYDGKEVQKITDDQTAYEVEKSAGLKISDETEEKKSHLLMQCVGWGSMEPQPYEVDIPENCDILLCTDGLSNRLTPRDFKDELKKSQSGSDALLNLVTTARKRGESDNITAVLIRRRDRKGK